MPVSHRYHVFGSWRHDYSLRRVIISKLWLRRFCGNTHSTLISEKCWVITLMIYFLLQIYFITDDEDGEYLLKTGTSDHLS